MSIYNTDEISLVSITRTKFGEETEVITPFPCRVEDNSRTFKGSSGSEVTASFLIMADPSFTGKKGDDVKITKIMGKTVTDPKQYEILEVFPAGAFSQSHSEVFV